MAVYMFVLNAREVMIVQEVPVICIILAAKHDLERAEALPFFHNITPCQTAALVRQSISGRNLVICVYNSNATNPGSGRHLNAAAWLCKPSLGSIMLR